MIVQNILPYAWHSIFLYAGQLIHPEGYISSQIILYHPILELDRTTAFSGICASSMSCYNWMLSFRWIFCRITTKVVTANTYQLHTIVSSLHVDPILKCLCNRCFGEPNHQQISSWLQNYIFFQNFLLSPVMSVIVLIDAEYKLTQERKLFNMDVYLECWQWAASLCYEFRCRRNWWKIWNWSVTAVWRY